jgi:hypothetical protein
VTLQDFLLSVLGGSIALGPIVWAIFEKVDLFANMESLFTKRLWVAMVSGVFGLAAWGLAVFLGYLPSPAVAPEWAEAIWSNGVLTGLAAFTSSTVLHGFLQDRADVALDVS